MNVPPESVGTDRFEYGHELAESWKRQTLVNIVRLRYADAPVFMDITSIISSRSRSGKINGGTELWESPEASGLLLGAEGSWSNTPTITFQPLLGDRFTKTLLRPIPPDGMFRMMEAGWPAPMVLRIAVASINGIQNGVMGVPGTDRWFQLVEVMERLRSASAIGIRYRHDDPNEVLELVLRPAMPPEVTADMARFRSLLELPPDANDIRVGYGTLREDGYGITITTRSMLEIMILMGNGVDVPASHLAEQRARAVPDGADILVRVHSGDTAPVDAYASVAYRGHWFWIEDTDRASKAMFSFLMILFSLAENGQSQGSPLVTVPAR